MGLQEAMKELRMTTAMNQFYELSSRNKTFRQYAAPPLEGITIGNKTATRMNPIGRCLRVSVVFACDGDGWCPSQDSDGD